MSAAALAACSASPLPGPEIHSIVPTSAFERASTDVRILGDGFFATARRQFGAGADVDFQFEARIGDSALEQVQWVSPTELSARVPGTLPAGSHGVVVMAPNGTVELPNAFTVLPTPGGPAQGCDAGPACWSYSPANFDPVSIDPGGPAFFANCDAVFSTTDEAFTVGCPGVELSSRRVTLQDGTEAVLLAYRGLVVEASASLTFVGQRPAILVSFGDARIAGRVMANSHATQRGAGSDGSLCATHAGGRGSALQAGGGGAGHSTAGGWGGSGAGAAGGVGGPEFPWAAVARLRGGCGGGPSGDPAAPLPGRGGGALQLSASGELSISGTLSVSGSGGSGGSSNDEGGCGGGSGGTLILEGRAMRLGNALLTANGGGGGGGSGQGQSNFGRSGADGSTNSSMPAAGGEAVALGAGSGGAGGAGSSAPTQGALSPAQGGGGGGGSAGVIALRSSPGSCTGIPRVVSPPAISAECP